MIDIEIRLNRKDQISYYLSKGHAKKRTEGSEHLAVCNAVSILEYQFFYSNKEFFKDLMESSEIKAGFFEIKMRELSQLTKSFAHDFSLLSKYFLIGINLLVKNYPSYINLRLLKE